MAKAIIKKSGKDALGSILKDLSESYFYTLYSDNGQVIAHSETYTRKANCLKVISKYFPDFEVVDNTKK